MNIEIWKFGERNERKKRMTTSTNVQDLLSHRLLCRLHRLAIHYPMSLGIKKRGEEGEMEKMEKEKRTGFQGFLLRSKDGQQSSTSIRSSSSNGAKEGRSWSSPLSPAPPCPPRVPHNVLRISIVFLFYPRSRMSVLNFLSS